MDGSDYDARAKDEEAERRSRDTGVGRPKGMDVGGTGTREQT